MTYPIYDLLLWLSDTDGFPVAGWRNRQNATLLPTVNLIENLAAYSSANSTADTLENSIAYISKNISSNAIDYPTQTLDTYPSAYLTDNETTNSTPRPTVPKRANRLTRKSTNPSELPTVGKRANRLVRNTNYPNVLPQASLKERQVAMLSSAVTDEIQRETLIEKNMGSQTESVTERPTKKTAESPMEIGQKGLTASPTIIKMESPTENQICNTSANTNRAVNNTLNSTACQTGNTTGSHAVNSTVNHTVNSTACYTANSTVVCQTAHSSTNHTVNSTTCHSVNSTVVCHPENPTTNHTVNSSVCHTVITTANYTLKSAVNCRPVNATTNLTAANHPATNHPAPPTPWNRLLSDMVEHHNTVKNKTNRINPDLFDPLISINLLYRTVVYNVLGNFASAIYHVTASEFEGMMKQEAIEYLSTKICMAEAHDFFW